MQKWFIVSPRNKEGDYITNNLEEIELLRKTRNFSSLSCGYNSLEELKMECKIYEKTCSICDGIISLRYYEPEPTEMKEHCLCFKCNFWRKIYNDYLKNPNRIVINDICYLICKDTNDYFKGFGGREFRIKKFDSNEIIICRNLWCNGDVPNNFKTKLKNNAEFVNK